LPREKKIAEELRKKKFEGEEIVAVCFF